MTDVRLITYTRLLTASRHVWRAWAAYTLTVSRGRRGDRSAAGEATAARRLTDAMDDLLREILESADVAAALFDLDDDDE